MPAQWMEDGVRITESAVRQFQEANGLAPTGSLDPQTLSALGVSQ
jgi:peptidoglycan hydrolase-like protein with peptidoglycan-binding domain